ncbi:MAG: hypothetical protein IKH87_06375 [Firmicutes bacterium]|nr:hypothetical protein [Bacillota bacterium]MBR6970336.1 hypothetical protein [Bacillota bacterium]
MDIRFELAKKLTKVLPKAKGITLRSVRMEEGAALASAILMAGGYQQIREGVEDFRMRMGEPLACRSKGKSLEVYSEGGEDPLDTLTAFLSQVAFNSEDAMESIEFFRRYLSRETDSGLKAVAVEMTAEDLRIVCEARCEEGETPENVYSYVSSLLDRYDMGIIKNE